MRSRLQWAGHVERMADDKLPERAAELREQGRRRRGRPRSRWEDYGKRDVRKAGEEEDWKKNTRDRRRWKRLSDEEVKKLQAAPRPSQREIEEERDIEKKHACYVTTAYKNSGRRDVAPAQLPPEVRLVANHQLDVFVEPIDTYTQQLPWLRSGHAHNVVTSVAGNAQMPITT